MNEKIDLTQILKDCPKGFKLYSANYGDVKFSHIIESSDYPIIVRTDDGLCQSITKYGMTLIGFEDKGECTLFPSKDQRDWSKFTAPWYKKEPEHKFHVGQYITDGYVGGQITSIEDKYPWYKILDFMGGINTTIPLTLQDNYHLWTIQDAKDGDVVVNGSNIFIFYFINNRRIMGYCHVNMDDGNFYNDIGRNECLCTIDAPVTPATKEQRDLLFQKIKEVGYKWNNETKTLEKLFEHKFDPKTLQPFDRILVRDHNDETWSCNFFSHIREVVVYKFTTITSSYKQCIPYNDDTKHLVGTTEEAPEYYRYWEE